MSCSRVVAELQTLQVIPLPLLIRLRARQEHGSLACNLAMQNTTAKGCQRVRRLLATLAAPQGRFHPLFWSDQRLLLIMISIESHL